MPAPIFVLLLLYAGQAFAILIRGLEGPTEPVTQGADVILHCRFDLDEDELYVVKWFRGTREFYRYQPQLVPPVRLFPIEDVTVDLDASNGEKLVIRQAVPATSGVYRCEVSAEETFETHYRELNVTVLDAPMGDPVIYNIQSSYRLGDELRINCTSFDSLPGAALSWHLNGDPKEDDDVIQYPTRWTVAGGAPLETASVGLHIRRLAPGHFPLGRLTLSCAARLGSALSRSTTVKAVLDERPPADEERHQRRQSPAPAPVPPRPSADADKRPSSAPNLTGTRLLLAVVLSAVPSFH